MAIDGCLQCAVGMGLKTFMPARKMRPLRHNEERYFVPAEPAVDHRGVALERQRACVIDRATGQTRGEVAVQRCEDGRLLPEALRCFVDQGSTGLPLAFTMFIRWRLRGTWTSDFWHNRWSGLKHSLAASGLRACS